MNEIRKTAPRIGKRINATAGMVFFSTCALVFMGFIAAVAFWGVPGSPAGTSPNQQAASGQSPAGEVKPVNTGTRETTGWGAPLGARPPRH